MSWFKFIAAVLVTGLYGALFVFYTYAMNILNPQPDTVLGFVIDLMICLSLMGSTFMCAILALWYRPYSIWKSGYWRR